MRFQGTCIAFVWLIHTCRTFTHGQCVWPSSLQNSTWWNSQKGKLLFTTNTLIGLNFKINNNLNVSNWACIYHYEVDGIVILRSTSRVTIWNTDFRVFTCLQLKGITNQSYIYYVKTAKEPNLYDERLVIRKETDIGSITEQTAQKDVCTGDDVVEIEYRVLIREGQEELAATICPADFQNTFAYLVQDGGKTSCGTGNELWTIGNDSSTMHFNYTLCPTIIGYSNSGTVQCVYNMTAANSTVTTILSMDPASGYVFACLMSTVLQSGIVLASQSPQSCSPDQTPTDQPILSDGSPGILLELTPYPTGTMATHRPADTTTAIKSNTSTISTLGTDPTSSANFSKHMTTSIMTQFSIETSVNPNFSQSTTPTKTTTTSGHIGTGLSNHGTDININNNVCDTAPFAVAICILGILVLVLSVTVCILAYKLSCRTKAETLVKPSEDTGCEGMQIKDEIVTPRQILAKLDIEPDVSQAHVTDIRHRHANVNVIKNVPRSKVSNEMLSQKYILHLPPMTKSASMPGAIDDIIHSDITSASDDSNALSKNKSTASDFDIHT